jgi:hypothetical protein
MLDSRANKTLLRIMRPVAVFMHPTITRYSLRGNVEKVDPFLTRVVVVGGGDVTVSLLVAFSLLLHSM